MALLTRVACGMILVAADIRFEGVDLIADLVGWLIVLARLVPLVRLDRWFTGAMVAAGCGTAVSVFDLMAELQGWPGVGHGILQTALVICVCTALLRRLHDPARRRSAALVRAGALAMSGVLVVAALTVGADEVEASGAAAPPVVLLVLAGLAVFVWFVVLLAQVRHDPDLQPPSRSPPDRADACSGAHDGVMLRGEVVAAPRKRPWSGMLTVAKHLRHYYASLLIRYGQSVKTCSPASGTRFPGQPGKCGRAGL